MYGYTRKTPERTMKKWQVFYRTKDGGFGEIGWVLFKTKEEAEAWAADFKAKTSYVTETIVRHPAPIYSGY